MSEPQILQVLPTFDVRQETVPAPELGGAVIVRGLMASEQFALSALRSQALRRVREARNEHATLVATLRAKHDERCAELPPGVPAPAFEAPEFMAPELTFSEMQAYGRFGSELLARAVVNSAGLALATAAQWEVLAQHHATLVARLQAAAERLSGFAEEDVRKN